MQRNAIEQRAERVELLRSLLRVAGAVAISYYVVLAGGFTHSIATGFVSVVAIVATVASPVLHWLPAPGWVVQASRVAMVITGGLLTLQTDTVGWIVFGIGAINLLGSIEVDAVVGVLVLVVGAVPIVIGVVMHGGDIRDGLYSLAATFGIGVISYSRRLIRDRRRQDAELVERSKQLEQQSLELISQTEQTRVETARAAALEERTRIARDIHDVLAHSLGGLVVQLDAADALLAAGGHTEQVVERVRTSRRLAVEGLQEARAAVRELRTQKPGRSEPSGTDDQEADVADRVVKIVRGPVGVQLGIDFDVVGEPHVVPAEVATAFAAVARESLTNINKHAAGQRTAGSLIFADGRVRLELINAIAPAPQAGDDHDQQLADTGGGFGVPGMQQRLADIGGSLIAGRNGDRWTVSALWPNESRPDADSDRATDLRSLQDGNN